MSQWSTVRQSRTPWQHTATQRAEQHRSPRQQLARGKHERARPAQACKEAQARLRQRESQSQGLPGQYKGDLVFLALQLFCVARLGCRAGSRVLSLLAWALGIKNAPCPHTIIHWVMRLSIVRIDAARTRKGLPLRQAPFPHGLMWMIASSMGLGPGQMWAVLACDAHHHPRSPGARTRAHVRCLGVGVADSWSGAPMAEVLKRLIAPMGRPAAARKDGGSERQKAVAILEEQGLASPCIDAISHAIAGMRKGSYQDPPPWATFLAAWGRVSGTLTHTILACLAPPTVRTKARFMSVHRLLTWADQVRGLSPAGGAKQGSTFAKLRACLEQLPACKACMKRFRTDAHGLLACQKMLKTKGLAHDTRAQCQPLMAALPSSALRQELRASLAFGLETATTLGRHHVGEPISADALASLFGVAKRHGVGETQEAKRQALGLPAFCSVPTREEAEHVLAVRVARQQACPAQFTSLTKPRREGLGHPERLERLSRKQAHPHVELIPRPKNPSNYPAPLNISNGYEEYHGAPLRSPDGHRRPENAAPPGRTETALIS